MYSRLLLNAIKAYGTANQLVCHFLSGLLLFSLSTAVIAQDIISLDSTASYQNIGLKIDFIEDPQGDLQLDDISSSGTKWHPSNNETISLGYTNSAYWLRLFVKNNLYESHDYLFAIEYPLLDKIDLYWGSSANGYSQSEFGRSLPLNIRPIKHRFFLQQMELDANQTLVIYLRVKTESAMQVPISIWTKDAFIESEQDIVIIQGLYFGVIFIMLFYNLFLYISIRDRTYLAYAASVLFIGLVQASIRGFTSQYLFPDSPLFQKLHMPIIASLSAMFLGIFTIMFLELKTRNKPLYYVSLTFVVAFGLIAASSPILDYATAVRLPVIMSMLYALISNYTGFYIWYHGFKPASYYSIAYSMLLMAVVLLTLNKLGIIPRNFLTENALEIGSVLEVVLLSFALAYRITILKQEKEQAQTDLTVNLEKKVTERTQELNDAMRLLSSLNTKLARQNIEDSLSGVFNRRHFDETIRHEWNHSLRSTTPLTLIMADIDHFKKFNDDHGHAVGDECLKLVGYSIKSSVTRMGDMVFRYGGEEFAVVLPVTNIDGGKKIAENIRAAIAKQILTTHKNQQLNVTISMGVASVIPQKGSSFDSLIRHADEALYAAKDNGRNRVEVYQPLAE